MFLKNQSEIILYLRRFVDLEDIPKNELARNVIIGRFIKAFSDNPSNRVLLVFYGHLKINTGAI